MFKGAIYVSSIILCSMIVYSFTVIYKAKNVR
jgi:hypothetical protein